LDIFSAGEIEAGVEENIDLPRAKLGVTTASEHFQQTLPGQSWLLLPDKRYVSP